MAEKITLLWDCPKCSCKGGYGGLDMDILCGLCLPDFTDTNKAFCFGCGWEGAIEDAEITAVQGTPSDFYGTLH